MINRSRQQAKLIYVSKVKPHLQNITPPFATMSSTRLLQCFLRRCVTNTSRKEDAKTRKNAILKYKLNPLGSVSCPPSCDVNLLFRAFLDSKSGNVLDW